MAVTIRHTLNLRRQKKDGTYSIVLRLVYNRALVESATGYCIVKKDWDEFNQSIKTSSKMISNVVRINNMLQQQRANAYDKLNELTERGVISKLKPSEILKKIKSKDQDHSNYFFPFLNEEIKYLREAKRVGSADSYKGLYGKIKNFTNGNLNLKFHEIDYKFLNDLEKVHLNKGSQIGSLGVYMRTLRAVYNKAIKSGIAKLEDYPFKQYTIRKSDAKRIALSQVEFKRLLNSHFDSKVMEDAKNYYLLSFFFQGMNWMDMCLLQGDNISSDLERITYVRHKTGKRFSIKLFPQAKDIIENLRGSKIDEIGRRDYILPILNHEPDLIAAQRMKNKRKKVNKALKKIAEELKLDEFTIYTARHTYATSLKRNGTPTAAIQEGLGHKTEEMTQTYLNSFGNEVLDSYNEQMFRDL